MTIYHPHRPMFARCSDCRKPIGRPTFDLCADCEAVRTHDWAAEQERRQAEEQRRQEGTDQC